MNKKELLQLYYLNREIEQLQSRLAELESLESFATLTSRPQKNNGKNIGNPTQKIAGMPSGRGVSDQVSEFAQEIDELKALLDLNLKKCFRELQRLNQYIQSIEDAQMRMILSLRYINRLSWEEVAASISSCLSGESIRKAHDRFLKASEEKESSP